MPDIQKQQLQQAINRLPPSKQEQLIAELSAKAKAREAMTDEEKAKEDKENMELTMKFNSLVSSMDPQQKAILMGNMQKMMPSEQQAYMKQLIEDGAESLIPPSKEECADWKGIYLSYFNANLSMKKGRVMPLKYCVKNPRLDEVTAALKSMKILAISESNKKRPCDPLNPGRIKFRLFDNLGNLVNDKY